MNPATRPVQLIFGLIHIHEIHLLLIATTRMLYSVTRIDVSLTVMESKAVSDEEWRALQQHESITWIQSLKMGSSRILMMSDCSSLCPSDNRNGGYRGSYLSQRDFCATFLPHLTLLASRLDYRWKGAMQDTTVKPKKTFTNLST